jgi:potassium voltage-gated channel Eag-related subfamily H protein 6/hyperpolarization activated cyclic nucleotide-gated potassium channel 2
VISRTYAIKWFLIDLVSIIPFDFFYDLGGVNKVARLSRISKVYKLTRLSKIFRLMRITKIKSQFLRHMADMLKIGQGTERLVQLLISFFILQHVTACLWIFVGRMEDDSKINWIYTKGMIDESHSKLYLTAFYFTVTTLVTVGYGDITPSSDSEKFMCIVMMMLGVVSFSVTTGALSSIIQSYDSKEALLKEKISTLNQMASEFQLDIDLFNRLTKNIRYDHGKKSKDYQEFMDELPSKLRMELTIAIH